MSRPRARWAAAAGLPALLALACSLSAVTPTSTPQPSATPRPAHLGWPVVLRDFFLEAANDWEFGIQDGERAAGALAVESGKYVFDLTSKDGVVWWSRALNATFTRDFYAAVDVRQAAGAARADAGLIFRHDGVNYYYYQLSASGQFALYRYADGGWTELIAWTEAPGFQPEAVNRLGVVGEGARLTLYLNGLVAGEATDDGVPAGAAGVAVQIYDADLTARFEFDNFEWRAPRGSVSTPTPTP